MSSASHHDWVQAVLDLEPHELERLERQSDAKERAAGGKWREEDYLLPDEVVIRDERLA